MQEHSMRMVHGLVYGGRCLYQQQFFRCKRDFRALRVSAGVVCKSTSRAIVARLQCAVCCAGLGEARPRQAADPGRVQQRDVHGEQHGHDGHRVLRRHPAPRIGRHPRRGRVRAHCHRNCRRCASVLPVINLLINILIGMSLCENYCCAPPPSPAFPASCLMLEVQCYGHLSC